MRRSNNKRITKQNSENSDPKQTQTSRANDPHMNIALKLKESEYVFISLCKQCAIAININNFRLNDLINQKTTNLKLIHKYIEENSTYGLSAKTLQAFFYMVEQNLFHDNFKRNETSPDYPDEQKFDIFWVHNKIIYKQLLIVIKLYPEYLNYSFLYKIISNTNSIDSREREYALKFISSVYQKYNEIQEDVKSAIISQLNLGICSNELLDLTKLVIGIDDLNEADFPTKIIFKSKSKERKYNEFGNYFYIDILLPLHKVDNFETFYGKLLEIILFYLKNNENLIDVTINYILMHWPTTNIRKQDAYIRELCDIFMNFQKNLSNQLIESVFSKLCQSIESLNSNISKLTINIIINPVFRPTLQRISVIIFPMLINSLKNNVAKYWDQEISKLSLNALNILSKIDPVAAKKKIAERKGLDYKEKWSIVYKMSLSNEKSKSRRLSK